VLWVVAEDDVPVTRTKGERDRVIARQSGRERGGTVGRPDDQEHGQDSTALPPEASSHLPVIDLRQGCFMVGDWDDHREDARQGAQASPPLEPLLPRSWLCSTSRSSTRPGGALNHPSA
jgi:hypothetical protein